MIKIGGLRYAARAILIIIVALIFGVLILYKNYASPQREVHKILKINKIESVQGDSSGLMTDVYYMVSTDKGAYKIKTEGLNACLECIGIEEGKTYILTTRGINYPLFGMYPNIVKYEIYENNN